MSKDKVKELIELRARLYKGGGDAQIEKMHLVWIRKICQQTVWLQAWGL